MCQHFALKFYHSYGQEAHLTLELNRLPRAQKSSGKVQTPESCNLGQRLLHNTLTGSNNGVHSFHQITGLKTVTLWWTECYFSFFFLGFVHILTFVIASPCPYQNQNAPKCFSSSLFFFLFFFTVVNNGKYETVVVLGITINIDKLHFSAIEKGFFFFLCHVSLIAYIIQYSMITLLYLALAYILS